jgi:hypothetical protein
MNHTMLALVSSRWPGGKNTTLACCQVARQTALVYCAAFHTHRCCCCLTTFMAGTQSSSSIRHEGVGAAMGSS